MKYKELAEIFHSSITDTATYLHKNIVAGSQTIVVEGANAGLLDIDFGILKRVHLPMLTFRIYFEFAQLHEVLVSVFNLIVYRSFHF